MQKLFQLFTQLINFIFLIPDESQRSAALKKSEKEDIPLHDGAYMHPAYRYQVVTQLPRPQQMTRKSSLNSQARHRVGVERQNGYAYSSPDPPPPPPVANIPVQPPVLPVVNPTEAHKRRNSADKKELLDTSKGLKNSQPLISVSRLNILQLPTAVPSVQPLPAPPPPPSSTPTVTYNSNNNNKADASAPSATHIPRIGPSELRWHKQIGAGGFGSVWRGTWHATPVAIKRLEGGAGAGLRDGLREWEEEVAMLARLRHPNICLLLGVCWEGEHRAIVTELVARGSLWDALRADNHNKAREAHGGFFWPPALIRKVGTVQWMAPEVLVGAGAYDESVDVYSLGLVCWEMMTGQCPYEHMKQVEIALAVVNTHLRPPLPAHCTQQHYYFLQ
eukprot:gene37633-45718_t